MTPGASDSPRPPGDRRARFALGCGLPIVMVVLASVPVLVTTADLPERVATHFDLGGRPDGSMTIGAFVAVTGALVAVGAAICLAAALKRPGDGAVAATGGFLGGFIGGLGVGIVATTTVAQRGLTDWRDAGGAGWMLLVTLVVATAVGALGARLAIRLDLDTGRAAAAAPAMQLADGEEAVWVTTVHSIPMLLVGWAGVVIGAAVAAVSNWPTGVVIIVASVPIIALSTFRVRADRRGLRIRYGRLPWPATDIDVATIEQATEIDVRPMKWGGWGYRGSLKLMRRAALVHRAGPGLRLDLVGGRVFVVTVDDPGAAVALLNAQVERRAST